MLHIYIYTWGHWRIGNNREGTLSVFLTNIILQRFCFQTKKTTDLEIKLKFHADTATIFSQMNKTLYSLYSLYGPYSLYLQGISIPTPKTDFL